MKRRGLFSSLLVLLWAVPESHAATVEFVATDLPDVTAEDLWRYDYRVSGRSFLQFEFFDIYFDPLLYRNLANESLAGPDWDVAILQQPNPLNLPPFDRGMFDAFALVDGPSLTGTFSVSFAYLGSGRPGSQPFDIFDAGSNLVESGFTTPAPSAVPEPSTFLLVLPALAAASLKFRRARRT
jgi:hypothetical protein